MMSTAAFRLSSRQLFHRYTATSGKRAMAACMIHTSRKATGAAAPQYVEQTKLPPGWVELLTFFVIVLHPLMSELLCRRFQSPNDVLNL